ncbi:MAG: hypothetical protein IKA75_06590 [Bacteroidaceae bacterium]|nr:hypothetical protein [Bacteroidaceae bacterium]
MALEKRKIYTPIMCNGRGLAEWRDGRGVFPPHPMGIGRKVNGHRRRDGWPFVCEMDGHPTKVRWPSDSRALG